MACALTHPEHSDWRVDFAEEVSVAENSAWTFAFVLAFVAENHAWTCMLRVPSRVNDAMRCGKFLRVAASALPPKSPSDLSVRRQKGAIQPQLRAVVHLLVGVGSSEPRPSPLRVRHAVPQTVACRLR